MRSEGPTVRSLDCRPFGPCFIWQLIHALTRVATNWRPSGASTASTDRDCRNTTASDPDNASCTCDIAQAVSRTCCLTNESFDGVWPADDPQSLSSCGEKSASRSFLNHTDS